MTMRSTRWGSVAAKQCAYNSSNELKACGVSVRPEVRSQWRSTMRPSNTLGFIGASPAGGDPKLGGGQASNQRGGGMLLKWQNKFELRAVAGRGIHRDLAALRFQRHFTKGQTKTGAVLRLRPGHLQLPILFKDRLPERAGYARASVGDHYMEATGLNSCADRDPAMRRRKLVGVFQ